MDSEELKRIILSLNEEQKKELVKQLIAEHRDGSLFHGATNTDFTNSGKR